MFPTGARMQTVFGNKPAHCLTAHESQISTRLITS